MAVQGKVALSRGAAVQELVSAIRRAGQLAMRFYDQGFRIRTKEDRSLVTEADEAIETMLSQTLRAFMPDAPVISEEMFAKGQHDWTPGRAPPRYWLVDPLDGTRHFISRDGEFSINVALIEGNRPAMGLVHAPMIDTTWTGAGPRSATVWRGRDNPHSIRARMPPQSGLTVLSSRSHGDQDALSSFLSQYRVAEHRHFGSAIKFCLIAEGDADLYPRFGTTCEWDTAAGHAILEAAGGRVTTAAGKPLVYGKTNFENPDFIARGAW